MKVRLLDGPLKGRMCAADDAARTLIVPYITDDWVYARKSGDPVRRISMGHCEYHLARMYDDELGECFSGVLLRDREPWVQVLCHGPDGPEWRFEMPLSEWKKRQSV